MTRVIVSIYVGIAACFVFLSFMVALHNGEAENPCLEYGPEKLSYMYQMGKIVVPVYHQECIKRALK